MRIHCIGDSHTSFFSGYNYIQPEFPEIGKSIVKNIFTYRIGAPLAYNLCELTSRWNSNQKLFKILDTLNPSEDYILLCFGEIDCRTHIIKQAEIKGKEILEIVVDCVKRYLTVILEIKLKGFSVGVWNAIPTALNINNPDSEYPYYGNFLQRNKTTFMFNEKLKEYANIHKFDYFGIFELLIDKDWITKQKYFFDKIHLSSKALPYTLRYMRRINEKIEIRKIEFLKIRINFFVYMLEQKFGLGKFIN